MDCLINLAALCLFDPSHVYVRAETLTPISNAHKEYEGDWCRTRWCSGPLGVVRLGVHAPVTRTLTLDYGWQHSSRINTMRDRGYESLFLSITWRPFN
jgi:hypothetical protein